jgi:tetratricopeptide (TPR) repeat protein
MNQSRVSVRFCAGCGEPAAAGARFCVACGSPLRGEATVSSSSRAFRSQTPALAVLGAFLAIGLVLWVTLLRPAAEPGRLPLAPKNTPAPSGNGSSGASLPTDHPPIDIPAEVRTFIADLEGKAAVAPRDLETWKNLAQVQYRAGQIDKSYLEKAESSFRHALEIDAKDLDALRGLANVYFDRDDYARAIEWYSRYLKIEPDDPNVRTDLGTMHLYSGQIDAAVREYEKVIAADPKFYQAYFNLGIAKVRQGESAGALEALQKAKSLAPDDATRTQIQAMIDRASGAAAGSAGGDGFQQKIEQSLRSHPIAGPKVVRVEWSAPREGRVVFADFPMEAMPEFVRTKFLDRLKTELGEASRASGGEGGARLDLVDRDSSRVMATVTTE